MSNAILVEEVIRLGFKVGPLTVLTFGDVFALAKAVKYGHAKLTKAGRAEMMKFVETLKFLGDEG